MFALPTLHKRSVARLTVQCGGYDLGNRKTDAVNS